MACWACWSIVRSFIRIRDHSVYVAAALVVGMIGIIDEWIQWVVPSRYWGLRDLQINAVAGGLTQLAIGAGLRPAIVSGKPSWQGYRRLCQLAALGLFALSISYVNTPERIAAYATAHSAHVLSSRQQKRDD